MSTTAEPILEPADYVTLAVARNLTTYRDTRIPDRLPTDPEARRQAIDELNKVAAEYTERARQDAIVGAGITPEFVVAGADKFARGINEVVRSWSEKGAPPEAGISAVADPAVERLMIAVLTWRLAAHPAAQTEVYAGDAIAAAAYAAGESAALYLAPPTEPPAHATGHTYDAQTQDDIVP